MIHRFYVHNFRCLENFNLTIAGQPSVLLIGKNGSGKTTVMSALQILQRIGRGISRVGDLVKSSDFSIGRSNVPMRFEIEVELDEATFHYVVAFELPEKFKELRVLEEKLLMNGKPVYSRHLATVSLAMAGVPEPSFGVDWHIVALPIIQIKGPKDPVSVFKRWLACVLILRPIPSFIRGVSEHETLQPNSALDDLGAWFAGIVAQAPSAYSKIDQCLRPLMPDLRDITNPQIGGDARSLVVRFKNEKTEVRLPFDNLSDGEKCLIVGALVVAASEAYDEPVLCFWDEPDNYLDLSEVQHFVMLLRRAFGARGQFIATSHNPEAIRSFSNENTFYLYRNSHLEPTLIRPLDQLKIEGDLVGALTRGDVEP